MKNKATVFTGDVDELHHSWFITCVSLETCSDEVIEQDDSVSQWMRWVIVLIRSCNKLACYIGVVYAPGLIGHCLSYFTYCSLLHSANSKYAVVWHVANVAFVCIYKLNRWSNNSILAAVSSHLQLFYLRHLVASACNPGNPINSILFNDVVEILLNSEPGWKFD